MVRVTKIEINDGVTSRKDITEIFNDTDSIYITLPDGSELELELFVRAGSCGVNILADYMFVLPRACNVVTVGNKRELVTHE